MHDRIFQCKACGNIASAPKVRNQTAAGHIKSMYCYICRMITNHVQINEFDRRMEDAPAMNEISRMERTTQTPIEVLLQVGEDGRVSARDTYRFLGLADRQFARWAKSNISDNSFAVDVDDYLRVDIDVETPTGGAVKRDDYRLSVPFAKKLCMLSKTERGEQARDYFIKVEKALQQVALTKKFNIPQTLPDALRLAANLAEENGRLAAEVRVMKPKAIVADAMAGSNDCISVSSMAKILHNIGHDVGRDRLYAWMRENGYVMKQDEDWNLPTQRSIDRGLLQIYEKPSFHQNQIVLNKVTMVTPKGQTHFINHYQS